MTGHQCAPILSRRQLLIAGLAVGAVAAVGAELGPDIAEAATTPAGRYTPTAPVRVADTRMVNGGYTRTSPNEVAITVVGRGGVQPGDIAVAAIITAYPAGARGFLTVWPAGAAAAPAASTVNHAAAGPAANITLVKVGAGGQIKVSHFDPACAFTVDIIGRFTPAASATSGRYQPITPARPVDTRRTGTPFTAGETRQLAIAASGIPADATAVVVNITAPTPPTSGSWTVWAGGTRPDSANLHVTGGATRAAAAIVPTTALAVSAHSTCGGHLIVDVVGYFTGPSAPSGTVGLFAPCDPTRILDTRLINQQIPAGLSRESDIAGIACQAFSANITITSPAASGYGTVWAAGEPKPGTSTLNWPAACAPIANFAVVQAGVRGVAVSPSTAAHMIIDITGWFTGVRSTGTTPPSGAQPYGIAGVNMESFADDWFDYGASAQGRPLRGFRYGTGNRRCLLVTGIHGNEHSGTSIVADLVTRGRIPGWTVMIVPIANPDARAANVRWLGNDMNRDFEAGWQRNTTLHADGCVMTKTGPTSLTLTESRQLRQAVLAGPLAGAELSVSHHDNYNWVAPQMGSPTVMRTLCTEYATAVGLRTPGVGGTVTPKSIHYADVPGGFEKWMSTLGAKSILIENKAGYSAAGNCAGVFGQQPAAAAVAPHYQALRNLLLDARLPA